MKLIPAALLAILPLAPAFAQTKPTTTHRTPSRTTHSAAKPACEAGIPPLGAAIPKVAGCPGILYALRYVDTLVGTGALAETHKWYTVAYTGYLPDGSVFDSSIGHDPIVFPAGAHRVIPGWDTGFEGMHVGGKRRLYIPYQLAYGELGNPPRIPPKTMLIFDVELVAISDAPPQPKTPPAPPAPPASDKPATPPPTTDKPATPPPATDKPATPPAN